MRPRSPVQRSLGLVAGLLVGGLVAGCSTAAPAEPVGSQPSGSESFPGSAAPATPEAQEPGQRRPEIGPTSVAVMTFNIWLGGGLVDSRQVVEAIRSAKADVVGLQEAAGRTEEIAQALGWHAEPRLHVVSRYPIIVPPEARGDYVYIQVAPGQVFAMGNIHLPSSPYGPNLVANGKPLDAVLRNEEVTRVSVLEPLLGSWQRATADGMPMVVTGDFNSPSHLDWVEATVGDQPHWTQPIAWPTTVAMDDAGFTDTFRAANPDPTVDPGITWTYGKPWPRVSADERIDRIDLVFASEGIDVTASSVVGPGGSPDVDVAVDPYPSDHRGVVSTVVLDPVEPPPFAAVETVRVERGDPFGVRYHAPGGKTTDRLVVVRAGRDAGGGRGIMWLPPMEASFFGQVLFGSGALSPGAYDVVLLGEGDAELSRSRFWVVAPGARPQVDAPRSVVTGRPFTVRWRAAPGELYDWIGIYQVGELDLYNDYWGFAYTEATVDGRYTFRRADLGRLPRGDYVAVLASDDHYIVLDTARFTVR